MPPERSVLPADVLATALRADATRPRLTFYDDAPGATRGERIELSAKVLTNWVSKAGNALQEELDVTPGSRVLIDLPQHWRAVYWALAVWSVGATVVLHQPISSPHAVPLPDLDGIDLVITADVALVIAVSAGPAGPSAVLVSLPMLSRGHADPPDGVFDEARELATYGDVFDAWEVPSPSAVALEVTTSDGSGELGGGELGGGELGGGELGGGELGAGELGGGGLGAEDPSGRGRAGGEAATAGRTDYGDLLVPRPEWGDRPRVELAGTLGRVLVDALSAWHADGSVVLVRDPDGEQEARRTSEGVTVRLG